MSEHRNTPSNRVYSNVFAAIKSTAARVKFIALAALATGLYCSGGTG